MRISEEIRAAVRTPIKGDALMLGPSFNPGDFDSHAVDCPFVFSVGGKVGMTIVGWDGVGYQTGLSWLGEDDVWSRPQLVFPRDAGSKHRRYNAALTSILRDNELRGSGELVSVDGWYYGTYHAYPNPGYEEGSGVIGIVRSRDLLTWEEYGDLLDPAEGAAWERGGLYKSWLMRADGRFWLFYNAKNQPTGDWREQTGAAVSADLRDWRRVTDQPLLINGAEGAIDDRFASDPCVLRHGDVWIMFYFGLSSDGRARDAYAVSTDLLAWQKGDEVLVDVGPSGAIDSQYSHKPAVIFRNGKLEHYYCAVSPLPTPVELAGYSQPELRGIAVARSAPE